MTEGGGGGKRQETRGGRMKKEGDRYGKEKGREEGGKTGRDEKGKEEGKRRKGIVSASTGRGKRGGEEGNTERGSKRKPTGTKKKTIHQGWSTHRSLGCAGWLVALTDVHCNVRLPKKKHVSQAISVLQVQQARHHVPSPHAGKEPVAAQHKLDLRKVNSSVF